MNTIPYDESKKGIEKVITETQLRRIVRESIISNCEIADVNDIVSWILGEYGEMVQNRGSLHKENGFLFVENDGVVSTSFGEAYVSFRIYY